MSRRVKRKVRDKFAGRPSTDSEILISRCGKLQTPCQLANISQPVRNSTRTGRSKRGSFSTEDSSPSWKGRLTEPAFGYDGHMKLQTFSIVESGKEILTVPGLFHAALAWIENPEARQVYRIAPTGPVGPDAWEQVGEVSESELRAALPVHF